MGFALGAFGGADGANARSVASSVPTGMAGDTHLPARWSTTSMFPSSHQGTPPQRATGQRLVAIPVVGGARAGGLRRWQRRRVQQAPALGELLPALRRSDRRRPTSTGTGRLATRSSRPAHWARKP